jgi:hypothetical protein
MTAITVSKLDAARRQLRTAIRLWFYDADPVSAHTLAYAAHEILRVMLKKRSPKSEHLFDLMPIKKEYRPMILEGLKKHANFFKHASRDPNETIEFNPGLSEIFILISVVALGGCGEAPGDEESAFMMWTQLHSPELLNPEGQKLLHDRVPIEALKDMRRVQKSEFLENWLQARALLARQSRGHF